MKIAFVHELLTVKGGAEKVLQSLAAMFPDAPIYTLLYDRKKFADWFPPERIRTSSIQWMTPMMGTNHHAYLPYFPKAVEQWDFSEFDCVISISSAFAHGIITQGKTRHIAYINSPARYLWDRTQDILSAAPVYKRWYASRLFHRLRQWDAAAGARGDLLLAASKTIQRRIELYWRRESTVLYPPVDIDHFPLSECPRGDYFVIASQLVPYKRIELAIEACKRTNAKLIIAGEGSHCSALQKIAGPTIEFAGYLEHGELVSLLQHARAFLFPGDEDFGIAPIEAMACGTPVIAFRGGGALETMFEFQTGVFFNEPTVASLAEAIKTFDGALYHPEACRKQAELFSREKFEEGIRKVVDTTSP